MWWESGGHRHSHREQGDHHEARLTTGNYPWHFTELPCIILLTKQGPSTADHRMAGVICLADKSSHEIIPHLLPGIIPPAPTLAISISNTGLLESSSTLQNYRA